MTIRVTLAVMLAVAVLAGAGCGSSGGPSSNDNQSKIEAAEAGSESVAEIEATLKRELGMTPDSSGIAVGEWIGQGGECTALLIATGGEVGAYEEDEWFVTAPDGAAGIKIVPTENDAADCLREVTEALGW